MVSSTTETLEQEAVGEVAEKSAVQSSIGVEGIPAGRYRIVGLSLDTTGRLLTDEICQIAGHTRASSYAQYVMPYKNLSPPAKKKHKIRIVTVGKFRMLKSIKTNKVLQTKSEISALTEFIQWLKVQAGDDSDGVILVYHEQRKVIPMLLLEALYKYNLLDEFKETVKGFVNGFKIAEKKCDESVGSLTLHTLSKVLFEKKMDVVLQKELLESAANRARLAFQIVEHLTTGQTKTEESTEEEDKQTPTDEEMVEFIREFVNPMQTEEIEHAELKVIYQRETELRKIYKANNRRDRQKFSPLRSLMAEHGINYEQLQSEWIQSKTEGLEKLLNETLPEVKSEDLQWLLEILDCHFDPAKQDLSESSEPNNNMSSNNNASDNDNAKSTNPATKQHKKKRSPKKRQPKSTDKENKSLSESESPDTTTITSPVAIKELPLLIGAH